MLKYFYITNIFTYICQTKQLKFTNMKQLTITQETFNDMITGLIKSGVTFEAEENKNGWIVITFLGGY